MDFRQLEAFCAIVEWGTFSEAAKHLFITQPTISNHIHSLEKSLNTILLTRTTKSLSLTDEGRQFYEYAKNLLRLRDKALQTFRKDTARTIRLGASSIPSAYLLPEVLSAYRSQTPEITFDVFQADSSGILSQLYAGGLDVGIVGTTTPDDHFHCCPIYQDEMVLVTPATSHYQKLKAEGASLEAILQEPYLMREDGSGTKREAEQFLETLGMDSTSLLVAARMNDLESIKQSIIYGLGISILSKKVTLDLEEDNCVLTFPLAKGGVYRSYYLIYRKNKLLSPDVMAFIHFIETYYQT